MKHEAGKKSKYLCPHCGSVLYHEKPDTTLDNYPLVCPECDENFFKCECDDIRLAYDALDVIDKELRPEYLKTHYLGDRYWKARGETCDYVKEHAAEMFKLSDAEFRNRVAEVFYANLKK